MKEIASRYDIIVTFMAKWHPDLPGCSGHIHQSLWSLDGKVNLFYDEHHETNISTTMRHYIGGQAALMPEMTALAAPTINSYKRLAPGAWAPTTASWGIENRTTAIRAIPFGENSTRVENRLPGADVNPYIAMAASLASGLYGIANEIEPPEPWEQNAYTAPEGTFEALPQSLEEAVSLLKHSVTARDILGASFVDHYVATREWEVRQYGKAITDWELKRYFEGV
jgi:glutamine synthetase